VTQAAKHRKGTLVIRIVDTGPGMDQDYLVRVFDPFSQADDSVTRLHGGSGLGTTISRDLIRLMSGELRIKSAPGIGTRVEVELKLPSQPLSTNDLPELPQQMVLIGVGDQADVIRQIFKAVAGLSFLELGMGEAQRILHTFEPRTCFVVSGDVTESVVLMLRAHWRRNGRQSLPVIIGFGPEAEREAAINLGLSAFVTASAEHREITNTLRVAAHLFPKRHTGYEPIESGIQGLILIAEDNSTNQIIARMTLERAGYRCHVVGDGERALDELQTGAYDLALIDMHMPVLDGLDVARLYNFVGGPEPLRTPIVMVTADNRPDLVADADLVGITRFAIKPLRPSQLLQIVKELVSKRQVTLVNFDTQHVLADIPSEPANVLDDALFTELMLYMNVPEAQEFFGEFAEDAERYISTVDSAMDGGVGATKMKDDMHALCGAARTVGAIRLAAISRRIEYSSESDEHYDPRTYSSELKHALADVMAEITKRLSDASEKPQES
jgi:two-component system sensor histidine kinase RpfC